MTLHRLLFQLGLGVGQGEREAQESVLVRLHEVPQDRGDAFGKTKVRKQADGTLDWQEPLLGVPVLAVALPAGLASEVSQHRVHKKWGQCVSRCHGVRPKYAAIP